MKNLTKDLWKYVIIGFILLLIGCSIFMSNADKNKDNQMVFGSEKEEIEYLLKRQDTLIDLYTLCIFYQRMGEIVDHADNHSQYERYYFESRKYYNKLVNDMQEFNIRNNYMTMYHLVDMNYFNPTILDKPFYFNKGFQFNHVSTHSLPIINTVKNE